MNSKIGTSNRLLLTLDYMQFPAFHLDVCQYQNNVHMLNSHLHAIASKHHMEQYPMRKSAIKIGLGATLIKKSSLDLSMLM